jgi:6-phosphogluconolactonase
VTEPTVLVSSDAEELASRVAEHFLSAVRRAQEEGGIPSVALTGGTVAAKIHQRIAASPDTAQVDWGRVDVWFGDERYVPRGDPDRNELQARESVLDHLAFDPARVHAMPASDDGHGSVDDAAAAYGDELRAEGGGLFDVVMLGVGPDGHVASLFPGFPQLDVDDAIAVGVTGSPKPPPERVSLTFAALNRAREVWFVVSGDGKADAVEKALAPGGSTDATADLHEIPAVGVRGLERTVWFLDEGSASRLPR